MGVIRWVALTTCLSVGLGPRRIRSRDPKSKPFHLFTRSPIPLVLRTPTVVGATQSMNGCRKNGWHWQLACPWASGPRRIRSRDPKSKPFHLFTRLQFPLVLRTPTVVGATRLIRRHQHRIKCAHLDGYDLPESQVVTATPFAPRPGAWGPSAWNRRSVPAAPQVPRASRRAVRPARARSRAGRSSTASA